VDLDGAHVVQFDTTEVTGRAGVAINDGTICDGDPETDASPWGAFPVRPMCCGTAQVCTP
jgi:hypothetical protein